MRSSAKWTVCCAVIAGMWTLPAAADDAQTPFEQGVELQRFHKLNAAKAAFLRAYREAPTPMAALHVAQCEIELGHLVAAEDDLRTLAAASIPADAPAEFFDARATAQAELPALSERVPHLRIEVDPESAGATVTFDGAALSTLTADLRVDPGTHQIVVFPPDAPPEEKEVTILEGARLVTRIDPKERAAMRERQIRMAEKVPVNPVLRNTGIITIVLGGSIVVGGLWWLAIHLLSTEHPDGAAAALLVGTGVAGGGIAMFLVGNRRVPATRASLVPALIPARNGAALRWSF